MEFYKVKPRRIYEDVVSQIKDLMREGKLNPGDRLMGEREMASALGVSRTTLREALRTLEILSLVEVRPGDGTFVKDHHVNQIIEPLALALSVESNSFDELWETRIALEVECAGLAARRANEEKLMFIYQALEVLKKSKFTDLRGYPKADIYFHYMIAQASQNSMITRLLQTFAIHIHEMIKQASHHDYLHDIEGIRVTNDHIKIYEAIKNHDMLESRRLMKEHLEWARLRYKNI